MTTTSNKVAELLLRQDPPRDPLTGRLLKDLTPRHLASVLEKYPCLRAVAPELPDPHAPRNWEVKGTFNGQRVTSPEAAALLRDPAPLRQAPTKPEPRRHRDSTRAMAAAWHEAGHCVMALLLGHRAMSATILPGSGNDGHTIAEDTRNAGVNCAIDLAGQVADEMSGVPMSSDNYRTDNKDWPAEMRAEMKPLVKKHLTSTWGAIDEIAKRLLLRETLDEFDIRSAYEIRLRKWRAKLGVSATNNDTKEAPKASGAKRSYDFSKPEDVRAFNIRMGRDPNSEPIGTTQGYLLTGGGR